MKNYDLIIVGAGPAGLSCAIEAEKKNLNYVMIDKGTVVDSIVRFPVNMTFFSTADQLELDNVPFNSQNFRPGRTEAIRYYQGLVNYRGLKLSMGSFCKDIREDAHGFRLTVGRRTGETIFHAGFVVIATGFYDNPNLLNVPGEDLPHVSHYFSEALRFFDQDVVVVGGKNSAVEAALELFRSGARVTIIHRRPEIKESVKYWVLPDIQNRINEGSIRVMLSSEVNEITPEEVIINGPVKQTKIKADAVFILTGYHPNTYLFETAGLKYDARSLEPEINELTLETSITGLYLAGSVIAGRNANRIFIENSRAHGKIILDDISNRMDQMPDKRTGPAE